MYANVFQITAESAADAVDVSAHFLVPPSLMITDIPCMLAPIAERLHPWLRENEGRLPRDADGVVSLPALQHLGAHAHEFPDEHSVKFPTESFPSPPPSSATDVVVDNIYAVYADANFPFPPNRMSTSAPSFNVQRGVPLLRLVTLRLYPSASAPWPRTSSSLFTSKGATP
ncbi:unnamed protein product [Ectocarpus sp. 6 AP-2014]